MQCSYVGYETTLIELPNKRDTTLLIRLVEATNELKQVTINGRRESVLTQPIGQISIPIAQLKSVPALFGEADIIKALALTPGVTVGNEGTTGLLVRGGSADQNLILLDNATVYNAAHLFGFVSSFNPDAIKSVDLYKASFPARYGGRLSSVVDISMKEGNTKRSVKEASVGLVSSRLLLEGPLRYKDQKASYMLSIRSSYFSLFTLPMLINQRINGQGNYANYWLYDINAKVNKEVGRGRHLYLSLYNGHDIWTANERISTNLSGFGLGWGNTTFSTRYTHILSQKLFLQLAGTYSHYQYGIKTESKVKANNRWETNNFLSVSSRVQDITGKIGIEWYANKHQKIQFGAEVIRHRFNPTQVKTTSVINPDTLAVINRSVFSTEFAAYAESEANFSRWLTVRMGLRIVHYAVQQKTYPSFEPRLNAQLTLSPRLVVKADYSQMRQFIHLLSNNSVGLPNDIWVPATARTPPQAARQLSVGIGYQSARGNVDCSVDVYKKWTTGLIDYPTGTGFLTAFNRSWESLIERNGTGLSQGVELMIHKKSGRLKGWTAYTLSKHQRRFSAIDGGQWYAAPFDRRHVFSTTGQYALTDRISLAATWQFQSGQPTTLAVAQYPNATLEATAYPLLVYAERNNFRMPSFHRLDLGATFTHQTRKRRSAQWVVGVYNAYNRANPFYLDFKQRLQFDLSYNVVGFSSELVRQGVFPVLPYVSYSLTY